MNWDDHMPIGRLLLLLMMSLEEKLEELYNVKGGSGLHFLRAALLLLLPVAVLGFCSSAQLDFLHLRHFRLAAVDVEGS